MLIQKVIELSSSNGRDMSKYSVNGEGEYNKSQLGLVCCEMTLKELVENSGLSFDAAVAKINEVYVDKSFTICSNKAGVLADGRCKSSEVKTSKGNVTIYVNNQWTVEKFANFVKGMNEKFNNEEEKKERLSEITVTGQKKLETLKKEFNEKFPFIRLSVYSKDMMNASSKTPLDSSLTIAQARVQDAAKADVEISIHGKKLVKNLETEFLENYGLYVEVCYTAKDGSRYYTSGSADDMTLASFNKKCEADGCQKDVWK